MQLPLDAQGRPNPVMGGQNLYQLPGWRRSGLCGFAAALGPVRDFSAGQFAHVLALHARVDGAGCDALLGPLIDDKFANSPGFRSRSPSSRALRAALSTAGNIGPAACLKTGPQYEKLPMHRIYGTVIQCRLAKYSTRETKQMSAKFISTIALLLFAFLSACLPRSSHAADASLLLRKISLSKDRPSTFTSVKRNSDGSFSVAQITACFLGRCPNAGDICCHGVHSVAGNVYWCCHSGQRCGGYNACQ
jgi:hypothetical protein